MTDFIVISEVQETSVIFVGGDQGPQGIPGYVIPVNLIGDVTGSGLPGTELQTTLSNSGVTAGTYGYHAGVPVIVTDSKGRIVQAVTTPITINADAVDSGTLLADRLPAFSGDITTTTGSSVTTLKNSGVTAGTYTKVTVDAKGIVTNGIAPTAIADLGITNVYTKTEVDTSIANIVGGSISFNNLTDKPTTLLGYGITDAVPSSALGDTIPILVNSLIPAQFLPSYVDDVLEFANLASFPTVGETGKIFVAIDTGMQYRWSGTAYIATGGTPITDASLLTSGILNSARLPIATSATLGGIKIGNGLNIDSSGVVTANGTSNASDLTSGTLNAARLPAFGGDLTSTAGSNVLNLNATGVTAGSYTTADITVDSKGRITAVSSGTGGSPTLDGLTDVTITSPSNNQILSYDSTSSIWVNKTVSGGGTPSAFSTFTITDGELIVEHSSSFTLSLVDGEFIVEYT